VQLRSDDGVDPVGADEQVAAHLVVLRELGDDRVAFGPGGEHFGPKPE
jgi:hypothetical protein